MPAVASFHVSYGADADVREPSNAVAILPGPGRLAAVDLTEPSCAPVTMEPVESPRSPDAATDDTEAEVSVTFSSPLVALVTVVNLSGYCENYLTDFHRTR